MALRDMCEANIPGFSTGGALWFTDLCASDPYYILPVMSAAVFLATTELNQTPAVAGMSPGAFSCAKPEFRCNQTAVALCYRHHCSHHRKLSCGTDSRM